MGGQYTLLATYLVTFLVRWTKRSSMLRILLTRLLSFLHAGLVPRLILKARMGFCWRENNSAEFWTAFLSIVLNEKAIVVSRMSSATEGMVHNYCESRYLHVKREHNDLHS